MKAKEIVLIIGINSFLAKALVIQLQAKDIHVIGVYHNNKNNIPEFVEIIHISKLAELTDIPFKSIYFISAYISIDEKDIALLEKVNVALPKKVSELFSSVKIIYASSVSVYEASHKFPITEITKPSPSNIYGTSKLAGEQHIIKHQKYAILRISSIFGDGMKKETFIPKIIDKALSEKQVLVYGKGDRKQNYIHVIEVAKYMIMAANYPKNGIFLAVDACSYSNLEVVNVVAEETNAKIQYIGEDNSPSFVYDNSETRRQLNYNRKSQFKKELKELVKCFKKQL